jgi:hypothetical protein
VLGLTAAETGGCAGRPPGYRREMSDRQESKNVGLTVLRIPALIVAALVLLLVIGAVIL